uniref:SH3 domain-binding protein 5-like n=1 Tax=Hydra vulgaris TaxID=6087 RepID=T2MAQ9_HYDVU
MCDAVREQPDGDDNVDGFEEDKLDPRVEIELEKLNSASDLINILEKELDEARTVFRQKLNDATRDLQQLSKSLGNSIDKARPYFELLEQTKKAQLQCSSAVIAYERACDMHQGARKTISIAEDKLLNNPALFEPAWQEMLNNANLKLLEAEEEKLKNESFHHEAASVYTQLQHKKLKLENQLKKSINKARPYFDQKAFYIDCLENQKVLVQELESSYIAAKERYSKSLRELENISEDIHRKRNPAVFRTNIRDEYVSSERNSIPRLLCKQLSEGCSVKLNEPRRLNTRTTSRSSFKLDLDVDFDSNAIDTGISTKSPSAKSVDIGILNSTKYYTDFQLLDVKKLFDPEWRRNSKTNFLSQSYNIS